MAAARHVRVRHRFFHDLADFEAGADWSAPHPDTRTRLRRLAWIRAILLGVALGFFVGWTAIPVALVYGVFSDWRARRASAWLAWSHSTERVAAREGAFVRRTIVAPLGKLQTIVRRDSPFDRRWGMQHLSLDTAGGSGVRGLELNYLSRADCQVLASELTEAVDASRFRW